jgi:hypothetical protein
MLADRGVELDHVTLYRWVQRFAPELEKRMQPTQALTPATVVVAGTAIVTDVPPVRVGTAIFGARGLRQA